MLDENQTPIPEFYQAMKWNSQYEASIKKEFGKFLENGIQPQEIISTSFYVYNHYNELYKNGHKFR